MRGFALRIFVAVALVSGSGFAVDATPPKQPDAAELARMLDRLLVVGNVLYVAAHPDDENTMLLAWLENERLLRTGYLSVTRGDGGQNLIGPEQGPLLGLIRTEELLAARRIDGAEQFFTRARDFGYSKSASEALSIWGHDGTLADVVRAVRRFKPDAVITRFSPDDTDTHGHHTASARLAVEAFDKAADPSYEPEQVKRLGTWRARRVVWNASQFPGAPPRDFTGFAKLDVGGYSPMLGLSSGELAAESRSMHKSQGFGAAKRRGPAPEYFKVLAGEAITQSALDGIVFDWSRVPGAEKLADALRRIRHAFRPSAPELSAVPLLEARDLLDRLAENPWKAEKRDEIDAAVVACAGLFVEVTGDVASVSRGSNLGVTIHALARRPLSMMLDSTKIRGHDIAIEKALAENQPVEVRDRLVIPRDTPFSDPYWLDLPLERGRYPVANDDLIGLPRGPWPLEAELRFTLLGHIVNLRRAVSFKWTDPVFGERYRAVEVLPPVTVDCDREVLVLPDGKPRDVKVRLRSTEGAAGSVQLETDGNFAVDPKETPYRVPAGGETEVVFHVAPPVSGVSDVSVLRAVATVDGASARYDRGLRHIEHEHIPVLTLLPRAEIRAVRVDVVRHRRRVGYIPGAGDDVPLALRQLGYEVVELDPKAISADRLRNLESIVVGVRAFNVEPRLVAAHGLLMDWIARGGTLVVQYNTNSRIGPAPPDLGPFPFVISRDRTTDENATVEISKDPVLLKPNTIGAADFDEWVQERGLYYASSWDKRYRAPLTMSDPGEKPLEGALLVGKHGRGAFVYTGLSLFRQLPAGVPGAYRILVNLVEHGAAGQ